MWHKHSAQSHISHLEIRFENMIMQKQNSALYSETEILF